ncbi:MAG TPA: hypothetical protein VFC56_10070 [Stellaceae bacterium]|nr:hypothetical protein [Stellaceae bacterium]
MVFAVVTVGGVAAMHPGAVKAFYLNIYPDDPAKAQALDLCFTENHAFNRLDSDQRNSCYQHFLSLVAEVSSASLAPAAINTIDLQRAAGQGSLPRNDVRREEQTLAAAHRPH